MNNPYDLHSWSKEYRQDALHEVRRTQLDERLRENSKARSERGRVGLALASVLSLVRGA
jgi:hypothetical protein